MMTARLLAVALAGCVGHGACDPASAQALPPVTWEPLPNPLQSRPDSRALVWQSGPTGQTLYSSGAQDVFQRDPGSMQWTDVTPRIGGGKSAAVTAGGCLLVGDTAGPVQIDRTCDRGRTWTKPTTAQYVECLYTRPSDGATLGCLAYPDSDGGGLVVSRDDGATWTPLPYIVTRHTAAHTLIEAPGPDGQPRLVAGAANGIAFSDDYGLTWTKSNLWGEFRYIVKDLDYDSVTGTYYAGAIDFYQNDRQAIVLGSDDRGATWTVRGHRFPTPFVFIAVGRDGALYVGTNEISPEGGHIWRSTDGGATYEAAGAGYDNACVITMEAGPDGRIYVGGCSGVWRTVEALVVVGEESPAEAPRLGVSVRPNPAAGRAEVVLTLAETQSVRVSVFDVQGREVAVLIAGSAVAGEQRLGVDTSSWPAGVYVVRASAGPRAVSARLVVAR